MRLPSKSSPPRAPGSGRWRGRTVLAATAVAGLVLGSVVGSPSSSARTSSSTATHGPQALGSLASGAAGIDVGIESEVTLLTGDRVRLGRDKAGNLTADNIIQAPRPDGRTVSFRTFRHDDDFYVLPSDAMDLVASKRIDKELFNVPEVLASTSVAKPGQLPIILSYGKNLRTGVMRGKADDPQHAEKPITTNPR